MKFFGPAYRLTLVETEESLMFELTPQRRGLDFILASVPGICAVLSALYLAPWGAKLICASFFTMIASVFLIHDRSHLYVSAKGIGQSKSQLIPWQSVYRLVNYVGTADGPASGLYLEGTMGSICMFTSGSDAHVKKIIDAINRRFWDVPMGQEPEANYPFGLGSGKGGELVSLGLSQPDIKRDIHA